MPALPLVLILVVGLGLAGAGVGFYRWSGAGDAAPAPIESGPAAGGDTRALVDVTVAAVDPGAVASASDGNRVAREAATLSAAGSGGSIAPRARRDDVRRDLKLALALPDWPSAAAAMPPRGKGAPGSADVTPGLGAATMRGGARTPPATSAGARALAEVPATAAASGAILAARDVRPGAGDAARAIVRGARLAADGGLARDGSEPAAAARVARVAVSVAASVALRGRAIMGSMVEPLPASVGAVSPVVPVSRAPGAEMVPGTRTVPRRAALQVSASAVLAPPIEARASVGGPADRASGRLRIDAVDTSGGRIRIRGQGPADTLVTATLNGTDLGQTRVRADASFAIDMPARLLPGAYDLRVTPARPPAADGIGGSGIGGSGAIGRAGDAGLRARASATLAFALDANLARLTPAPKPASSTALPPTRPARNAATALATLAVGEAGGALPTGQADAAAESNAASVPVFASANAVMARPFVVVIARGDTLWTIARRTYGAGVSFPTIVAANADLIDDPDLIFPGQVFVLPLLGLRSKDSSPRRAGQAG